MKFYLFSFACVCLLASCSQNQSSEDRYQAKLQTAEFYYNNILPRTETLVTTMFTPVETVMQMKEEHFSFDHALGSN